MSSIVPVLPLIARHLPPKQVLGTLSLVCRAFEQAIKSPKFINIYYNSFPAAYVATLASRKEINLQPQKDWGEMRDLVQTPDSIVSLWGDSRLRIHHLPEQYLDWHPCDARGLAYVDGKFILSSSRRIRIGSITSDRILDLPEHLPFGGRRVAARRVNGKTYITGSEGKAAILGVPQPKIKVPKWRTAAWLSLSSNQSPALAIGTKKETKILCPFEKDCEPITFDFIPDHITALPSPFHDLLAAANKDFLQIWDPTIQKCLHKIALTPTKQPRRIQVENAYTLHVNANTITFDKPN